MQIGPKFPKLNDGGVGSRGIAMPKPMNDAGLKAHVAKLPMIKTPGNDVGLGIGRIAVPRAGSKNMSINEMKSRRSEVGRMPRA